MTHCSNSGVQMFKNLILSATLSIATFFSGLSFADDSFWDNHAICRAAVKTYFFLKSQPSDAADRGLFYGFRSDSGNLYTCRIEDSTAVFRWINKAGDTMNSRSTTFTLNGDQLVVKTDMLVETFVAD